MSLAATVAVVQAIGRPRRRSVPLARYPHTIEADYARWLISNVAIARRWGGEQEIERARSDWRDLAKSLGAGLERFAARVADHQAGELDRQTQAVLGVPASALGVLPARLARTDARKSRAPRVVPELDERIAGWVTENVTLITSLGDTPLAEVEQLVARAFAAGDRNTTLATALVERFGVAEDRARLIARDQIGKLNGRISADRHQRMGVTRFTWRDVGDNRVRPAHRHLNNTTWAYAEPPAEGLPGEPIQCRCHDEPIFDDVLAELDRLGF